MSFQAPPQNNVVPPGTQGNMMPGFHPPPGLPPPPMPPPAFPGFQGPPPVPAQGTPSPGFNNSGQGHRPHFAKKESYYHKGNYQNYRPPSDKPTVTVFVGNITEHASDALVRQLLMKCGNVVNWKRVQGADGKLQAFGFCEYVDPETGLRAIRLLHDLSFGHKNLVVKVDQKTKEMLEEYKKNKATSQNKELKEGEEPELDEATKSQDEEVKKGISSLLGENADVLSGKFKSISHMSKWKQTHSGSEENLEGLGMDKDKKHLISKEIRSFRDTYKDSQKQIRDKEAEDESRERARERERQRERSPEKESERSRSLEKSRSEARSRSRSKERDRESDRRDNKDRDRDNNDRERDKDRDRDNKDRDRDNRDRDRDNKDRRDRDRRDDRRDREGDRRDTKGSSRSSQRDRDVDEEDSYERRKRERRQKERSQAFVERLKAWETRERKKQREYDRELEKEREIESEQAREKKHLLEFLEDYDDEQDDPKYYRGSSFDRRLQARIQEMEADDKDRQKEMEEIEEIRKRLGDRVIEEPEEEPMEEEPSPQPQPQPQPEPEPEPEPRPTLQATFKPAVHVVEPAPKIPSPVTQSPVQVSASSQNHKPNTQEPVQPTSEVDGPETTQKKTFVFEMKSKVSAANSNRKKLGAVFNSEEDSSTSQTPKRKLVPLDYSEEEMKAVATAKSAEEKKKSIKTLIERIPTAKNELFAYSLDWECVDQSLIDRRIRPWVNKKIVEYIGEEEPSLVDFMCTKLLARSQPENILHDVSMVLDDEAEVFVVKMWRLLIYETEAKKIGLVK